MSFLGICRDIIFNHAVEEIQQEMERPLLSGELWELYEESKEEARSIIEETSIQPGLDTE